jgi:exonuclease SbcC
MILRSIQLEGWRSFVSQTSVGPFVDGLNIIHGPNGSGKSSLMMALARGLFDSHSVGGTDIQTARSWGRELAPKVTIEFEQNEEHFQLFKQFLDSPTAKLARKEDGTYIPFAESRAADDKARKLLAGEASKSGASDRRHWGLAQILWATQGSLQIDSLASGTRTTIQDALGAQITGTGTEDLENRIDAVYRQFFTPTGRPKSGASAPAVVGFEAQLASEKSIRLDLQQRLQEFEEASKRIEDLRLQTQTARKQEIELDSQLKTTREKVTAYQKLTGQQKHLHAEVKTSAVTYGSLVEKIDAIALAVKQHQTATVESEQLTKDLPAIKKLVEECRQKAKLADEKVKAIRGNRSKATTARQLAQLAQQHVHHLENYQELEKQLKQIEVVQTEIAKLHETRKPIVAPDKAAMERITRVARQRDDARLKLDAAVITVGIQLDSDQAIEVTQSEETGSRSATKDERFEIKGAPDVAFQIPGVGRFTATGPTADFESLREQWESATSTLQELTANYGTSDLASLEKLSTQAIEIDRQIATAQVRLSTLLDGDSIEKISTDRKTALGSLDKIHGVYPQWKTTPPVPAELSQEAEEIEMKFTGEIEAADEADDRAQEALQKETRILENHETKIATLKTQASTSETNLASLRKDGFADELRMENRTKLAMELDVAKGKLAEVEKQVEEFGDDPTDSLTVLEAQQKGFRVEADEAEKSLNTESGRLQQIISEAPYSKLVEVEEEIARLERDIARDRLHIDAIQLLHNTVEEQKSGVLQSLINPIRTRANSILQRIAGSRFDGLEFDDTLLPTGIAPQSNGEAVSLHQISGGEQEQVHFAVRMALANIAFPDSRQLVVLDDVFTYTDTTRLGRIATILEESAKRFQIVLLTCHPERYCNMSDAKFFNLGQIVDGE